MIPHLHLAASAATSTAGAAPAAADLTRAPHMAVGDRVIAPPTEWHQEKALRDGGPGTIARLIERETGQFAQVQLDAKAPGLLVLYKCSELKPAPTV